MIHSCMDFPIKRKIRSGDGENKDYVQNKLCCEMPLSISISVHVRVRMSVPNPSHPEFVTSDEPAVIVSHDIVTFCCRKKTSLESCVLL